MPLDLTHVTIVLRAQKKTGGKEVVVTYEVPAEAVPAPGLNLSQAQKDKLTTRIQQMGLVLDENDTQL